MFLFRCFLVHLLFFCCSFSCFGSAFAALFFFAALSVAAFVACAVSLPLFAAATGPMLRLRQRVLPLLAHLLQFFLTLLPLTLMLLLSLLPLQLLVSREAVIAVVAVVIVATAVVECAAGAFGAAAVVALTRFVFLSCILAWLLGLPHLRPWWEFNIPVRHTECKNEKTRGHDGKEKQKPQTTFSNHKNHRQTILEGKAVNFGSFW